MMEHFASQIWMHNVLSDNKKKVRKETPNLLFYICIYYINYYINIVDYYIDIYLYFLNISKSIFKWFLYLFYFYVLYKKIIMLDWII